MIAIFKGAARAGGLLLLAGGVLSTTRTDFRGFAAAGIGLAVCLFCSWHDAIEEERERKRRWDEYV